MLKFFFPLLGVGFNELRQIALTLCHRIVRASAVQNYTHNSCYKRSFDT